MSNLRTLRIAAGLTQAELADRAAVSRQLVGAAEAGRNLPRVDAGIALASALGVGVEELFSNSPVAVDVLTGQTVANGTLVRTSQVGTKVVTSSIDARGSAWGAADAVAVDGTVELLHNPAPGIVIAGCEPGLQLLEQILRESSTSAMSVMTSSRAALLALADRRIHAAVVHGPALQTDVSGLNVERFRLATWQVGLAAPADAASGWFDEASAGRVAVVQREPGAGVQTTFENLAGPDIPGPRARGHVEAVQRSMYTGIPALTIEPAARAVGADFRPLDTHEVEMWVATEWIGERFVSDAINVITGTRFQTALTSVGGYDLEACGMRVAL